MLKNQIIVFVCNLSQERRYILSVFILAFSLLLFYFYICKLNRKIEFYNQKIIYLRDTKSSLDTTTLTFKNSSLKKTLTQSLLIKSATNERLFLNLAKNSKLKITNYFQEDITNEDYCKTKYSLSLNGSFNDVIEFFKQMSMVKSTLKCCKLKLTNKDDTIYIDSTYNNYLAHEKNN